MHAFEKRILKRNRQYQETCRSEKRNPSNTSETSGAASYIYYFGPRTLHQTHITVDVEITPNGLAIRRTRSGETRGKTTIQPKSPDTPQLFRATWIAEKAACAPAIDQFGKDGMAVTRTFSKKKSGGAAAQHHQLAPQPLFEETRGKAHEWPPDRCGLRRLPRDPNAHFAVCSV